MSHTILVGIKLPKKVKEKIMSLRSYIKSKAIIGKYPEHDPHITLCLNSFDDIKKIKDKIKKIANSTKPFSLTLKGINYFPTDPVIEESILILKVENDSSILRKLQKKLIKSIHNLRNNEYTNWLLSQKKEIDKKTKANIIKTGTPIHLNKYTFHTTICSVPKKELNRIIRSLEKIEVSFRVKELSIFTIKKGKFRHHSSYNFINTK